MQVTCKYMKQIVFIEGAKMSKKPTYEELKQRILELEKIEKAFNKSENRYRRLTENFPDTFYRISLPDGKYEYVSPASEIIFGYPPEDWYTNPLLIKEIIHPDSDSYFSEQWENMINGFVPLVYEYKIVHKDTSERWINQRNVLIKGDHGQPVALEGIATDITERKRAEEVLVEKEAFLRTLINAIPIPLFYKNRDGQYLGLNRAFETFFGEIEEKLIGKSVFDITSPELAEIYHAKDKELLDGKERVQTYKFQVKNTKGELRDVIFNKSGFTDSKGDVSGLIGVISDITESKQTEDALIEALDSAEQANLAKSIFLSSMSHELRTPLNFILGFGQILETDKSLNPTQVNYVRKIISGGKRLLALVSEVLDLALIESGKTELLLESVDCSEVMTECLGIVQPLAEEIGICLDLGSFDPLMRVLADRNRLKQILINLLSNAIKYNSREGTVRIAAVNHEKGVRITVTDTGPGIPADKLGELFVPFNRLGKEAGTIPGTGIGLAFSKRLAKQMKGDVGLESTGEKGSCFWVELPFIEHFPSLSEGRHSKEATIPLLTVLKTHL